MACHNLQKNCETKKTPPGELTECSALLGNIFIWAQQMIFAQLSKETTPWQRRFSEPSICAVLVIEIVQGDSMACGYPGLKDAALQTEQCFTNPGHLCS